MQLKLPPAINKTLVITLPMAAGPTYSYGLRKAVPQIMQVPIGILLG